MATTNLLEDPLLSWRDRDGRRGRTTLPGILARLATGELVDFSRLRPHQFDAWCMFLTQLAAITMRRAGISDPRIPEPEWRSMLLGLTEGAPDPWCLVVDDLSRPAFFQPPVPAGSIEAWPRRAHPDDIDVLVTSKGHDVKQSLISGDDTEAWIFAIVTLQTMQGYPGRGYNRIARMNGGYGSRPRVGLASDLTIASRFLRDVGVLLDSWDRLLDRGFNDHGLALVWIEPWDGRASLTASELTPHFIEICWRLRCYSSGDAVQCAYTTTTSRRCLPEIDNGDTGDPWVPIERDKGALSVGRGGYHYELLTRIIFGGGFEGSAAQSFRPGDGDPTLFLASALARGQGKTEGLHDRVLPLAGTLRQRLGHPDTRAAAGKRAGNNVQQAAKMRSKVLYPAMMRLALGGEVSKDRFDHRVDAVFFDELGASLDEGDDEARLAWDRGLREIAWSELQHAVDRCCVPSARWYQAVSDAERVFRDCLKKQFPTLATSTASS